MTLALLELERPVRATWPYGDALPAVAFLDGVKFVRSRGIAKHPGTVAHYREDVARASAHAYVLADGSYLIDHVDDHNPDKGAWLAHFFKDVLG